MIGHCRVSGGWSKITGREDGAMEAIDAPTRLPESNVSGDPPPMEAIDAPACLPPPDISVDPPVSLPPLDNSSEPPC